MTEHRVWLLVPVVAILAGVHRWAALHTPDGTEVGQFTASVALLTPVACVILWGAAALFDRPRRGVAVPLTARRRTATVGMLGIGVPATLTTWALTQLTSAAAALALLLPLLIMVPRGVTRRWWGPVSVITAVTGVVLLVFGRNAGLGLDTAQAVYLTLTPGGARPGVEALLAVVALLVSGWCTTRLFRGLSTIGHTGKDGVWLAGAGAVVPVAAAVCTGVAPMCNAWVIVAAGCVALSLLALQYLATRYGAAVCAVAFLLGALSTTVATVWFTGAPFTTMMRNGTVLLLAATAVLLHCSARVGTDRRSAS
jgi:hypothetical protein